MGKKYYLASGSFDCFLFAVHVGIHVPDESVLEDLSPEEVDQIVTLLHATVAHSNFLTFIIQNEKLQQVLEEIKQLINSKSSDMQLLKIQNAIEEAQRKKQITFKTFSSVLKGTISTVKTLLTQKENLEKQILQKENQLQQLREGQGARDIKTPDTRASALNQEVSELKQQLLETDQKLNTAKVQHRKDLLKKSAEISTLSKQTHQLMTEKDTLVADLGSKIRSLETSLTTFSANQQVSTLMPSSIQCIITFMYTSVAQFGHGTAATAAITAAATAISISISISITAAGRTTQA